MMATKRCLVCTGLDVQTMVASTNSRESFQFLCTRLGLNFSCLGGPLTPPAMCSVCYTLWEETTVLMTTMQGIVNLIDRKVSQLRVRVKKDAEIDGHMNLQEQDVIPICSNEETIPSSTNSRTQPTETSLNWWYPSPTMPTSYKNIPPSSTTTTAKPPAGTTNNSNNYDEVVIKYESARSGEMHNKMPNLPQNHQYEMNPFSIVVPEESNGCDDSPGLGQSYSHLSSSTSSSFRTHHGQRNGDSSQNFQHHHGDDNTSEASYDEYHPLVKRIRRSIDFVPVQTFQNLTDAKQYILSHNMWRCYGQSSAEDGIKIIYLCKYSHLCSSRMRIFVPSNSKVCIVQRADRPHDHDPAMEERKHGIDQNVKDEILKLVNNGVCKPRLIMQNLSYLGVSLPSDLQLTNFLNFHRRKSRIGQNGVYTGSNYPVTYSSDGEIKRKRGRPKRIFPDSHFQNQNEDDRKPVNLTF